MTGEQGLRRHMLGITTKVAGESIRSTSPLAYTGERWDKPKQAAPIQSLLERSLPDALTQGPIRRRSGRCHEAMAG